MTLKFAQLGTLFTGTITTGLMAGLFAAFAYAVMPALRASSDRTFVEAMQRINVSILNGWFMTCFVGALLLGIAAVALHLPTSGHAALPWVIAALVLYFLTFMITGAVHIPMNNALDKVALSGHPHELEAARAAFEAKWVLWNVVRAVTNVLAFAALAWALILDGRAAATPAGTPASAAAGAAHYGSAAPAAPAFTATSTGAMTTRKANP